MGLGEWWRSYSQQMRDSSIILNELMAITTEHEETIFNIGKEAYQLYRKNQIYDVVTVDICKRIEDTVHGLEKHKKDFIDFEEFVAGDLAKEGVGKVSFKLKQGANTFFLNRDLEAGRAHLREAYEDLGRRVYGQSGDGTITNNPRIRRMCLYASRVNTDKEAKWKELEVKHKEGKGGLSFLSSFSHFSYSLMGYAGKYFKGIQNQQVAARAKIKSLYQGIHYNTDKDKDSVKAAPPMAPVTPTLDSPTGKPGARNPLDSPTGRPNLLDSTTVKPLPPKPAAPAQNWPMGGQPALAPNTPNAPNAPATPSAPAPPAAPAAPAPQWPMAGNAPSPPAQQWPMGGAPQAAPPQWPQPGGSTAQKPWPPPGGSGGSPS